jgi:hypothetical protein
MIWLSFFVAVFGIAAWAYVAKAIPDKHFESAEQLLAPEPKGTQRNIFGTPSLDLSVIDFKHPSVDEFRFFAGPGASCARPGQSRRLYSDTFSSFLTECLYLDIGVALHRTADTLPVKLHVRFLFPDGKVLCDKDHDSKLGGGKSRQSWVLGCSGRVGNAKWPVGKYMAEVSMHGALLGRGHFNMRD